MPSDNAYQPGEDVWIRQDPPPAKVATVVIDPHPRPGVAKVIYWHSRTGARVALSRIIGRAEGCPTCGAHADQPCLTVDGLPTLNPHIERPRRPAGAS